MSEVELQKITDTYYNEKTFRIKQTVKVSDIYDRFKIVLRNKTNLSDIRHACAEILKSVEHIRPVIEKCDLITKPNTGN